MERIIMRTAQYTEAGTKPEALTNLRGPFIDLDGPFCVLKALRSA